MNKNFNYEISHLITHRQALTNLAWDIKMKNSEPYVLDAVAKIYQSRDELKKAIEILQKGEIK